MVRKYMLPAVLGAIAACGLVPVAASARTVVGLSINAGFPGYYAPAYYGPGYYAPYYYGPPYPAYYYYDEPGPYWYGRGYWGHGHWDHDGWGRHGHWDHGHGHRH